MREKEGSRKREREREGTARVQYVYFLNFNDISMHDIRLLSDYDISFN